MKVENLIYVYLAICVGMILFNIVSAVMSRIKDKRISKRNKRFNNQVVSELHDLEETGELHSSHKKYLARKLRRIGNMRSFDELLEDEYARRPDLVQQYLQELNAVFLSLAVRYSKKEPMEAAYFPYLIKKYHMIEGKPFDAMTDLLFLLLTQPSIYCRENAMQAIYTIGDPDCVIRALKIVDNPNRFYHSKLLTDGLMNFKGDFARLNEALWKVWGEFSLPVQLAVLNYFRYSTGDYCEQFLQLMTAEKQDDEIRFACIRYFGRYHFDKAYPYLMEYVDSQRDVRWEYSAIASMALSIYPAQETIELLKANLYHRNWYIRFNSSMALEKMGLTYLDLIDIIEGNDRYASEIVRYRFDIRNIMEEERRAHSEC